MRRMEVPRARFPLFCYLLVMLLAGLLTLPAMAQPHDDTPPLHDNIFGIVEGMWFPELTCELYPGWERLIFDWSSHQPEGPDDWLGFLNIDDQWLQAATDCDREIVAIVKNVPEWATDGLPGAGVPRGLDLPIDDPGNLWAGFMRRTASYYASRGVDRFIILNEPDIDPGTYGFEFEGDLEEYFLMVKTAYLAAKEGNPAARIHLAGTTYWHDVNQGRRLFTDRLLERIRQDPDAAQNNYYFDAISLHIYFRTDTVYDIVTIYRDLLDDYGLGDKAIWINETNASPNQDPGWPVTRPQYQINLEQQAAFLIQAAALGLAGGAERIAAYKLYDQHLPEGAESFGLLSPADAGPRPAFYAWQMVIRHFNGFESASLARTEHLNVVRLIQINGQQTFVAWARTETAAQLEIRAAGDKAYRVDQNGGKRVLRPQNGVYRQVLPGARCDETDGCAVGGPVSVLVLPAGEITVSAVTPELTVLVFE
jgi:hypothetical protein